MSTLTINGKPAPTTEGWHRLGDELGGHFVSRIGWRLVTRKGSQDAINWPGWQVLALGPRSILTLRHGSVQRPPYYNSGLGASDYNAGGLNDISPCGDDGTLHDHDAIMQRCPVSCVDMDTGANRPLAEIDATNYSMTRHDALPEYGMPTRKCPDGQHLIRAYRIGMRHLRDPFVQMDLKALLHDAMLVWNREREAEILGGPKGQGHGNVGREWAWVAYLAGLLGNVTMTDRMAKIARHVQTPYGNLQIAPKEGNPPPPPGKWFSDMEAHFQVTALKKLGLAREAGKLANVCAQKPIGKYIEQDTGRGDQTPTYGTAPAAYASGVWAPDIALGAASAWPINRPDYMGGSHGPFDTKDEIVEALKFRGQEGETRFAVEMFT